MAGPADTPLDQEVYDRVLAEQLAKGTDKRIAEGRARSAGVLAYRKVHGEPERERKAPAAAQPAGDGEQAPAAAPAQQPAKPGQAEKHRLLALVPPEGVQRVEREQGDRINTWPHLMIEEFVALLVVTAFLIIFSTFVNAPLRELANPNLTPNPSKAPWYFLGLQELLRYFHPQIAGVMMPTLAIIGLIVVPYLDRNPSTKPGDRKVAIVVFTMFFMFWAVITITGSFFRGPSQNFVAPWSGGLFFDL